MTVSSTARLLELDKYKCHRAYFEQSCGDSATFNNSDFHVLASRHHWGCTSLQGSLGGNNLMPSSVCVLDSTDSPATKRHWNAGAVSWDLGPSSPPFCHVSRLSPQNLPRPLQAQITKDTALLPPCVYRELNPWCPDFASWTAQGEGAAVPVRGALGRRRRAPRWAAELCRALEAAAAQRPHDSR